MEALVDLFPDWRQSRETFEQSVAGELAGAKNIYINLFLEYFNRMAGRDYSALFDSPIRSQIVEDMRYYLPRDTALEDALVQCNRFFTSEYFAKLPLQYIQARMHAALKSTVKAGAFQNRDRAIQKLSGYYQDVDHVAHYAPYCSAIAVDQPMAELLRHPGLALEANFGVRVFSLNVLDEFHGWLDEIENQMSLEHRQGLRAAYD